MTGADRDPTRRRFRCSSQGLAASSSMGFVQNDDVIAVGARGTKPPLSLSSRNPTIRRSCHEVIRRAGRLAKRNRSMRGQRDWAINLRGKGQA